MVTALSYPRLVQVRIALVSLCRLGQPLEKAAHHEVACDHRLRVLLHAHAEGMVGRF